MRQGIKRRIEALEAAQSRERTPVIVYSYQGRIYDRAHYEPEARELSAAEVAALVAEHKVIAIEYVDDWRGENEGTETETA